MAQKYVKSRYHPPPQPPSRDVPYSPLSFFGFPALPVHPLRSQSRLRRCRVLFRKSLRGFSASSPVRRVPFMRGRRSGGVAYRCIQPSALVHCAPRPPHPLRHERNRREQPHDPRTQKTTDGAGSPHASLACPRVQLPLVFLVLPSRGDPGPPPAAFLYPNHHSVK